MNEPTSVSAAGYDEAAHREMTGRTADASAGFFLPHLHAGMRLLDVGCGQGTITLGLAAAVAPSEVVGIDVDPAQVESARSLAGRGGVPNVSFQEGNTYALPFPDASFDAVFANQLLLWLSDPLAALREFRRVLRPGGVAGLSTLDNGLWVLEPSNALLAQIQPLFLRGWAQLGASMEFGRTQKQAVLDAGFARAESMLSFGPPSGARMELTLPRRSLRMPEFRAVCIENGWATDADLDAMLGALDAVEREPGMLFGMCGNRTVAWA